MKKEYKEKMPQWINDINKDDYFLVLSNDIDSLATCIFLNNKFGLEIGGFYSFDAIYVRDGFIKGNRKALYVDADMATQYCFGNHVTIITNPNAINMNMDISIGNYSNKYAGSTLMMVMSLFGEDISSYSDEQIQLLMCIDSAFLGYYIPRFQKAWLYWYHQLEFPKVITSIAKISKEICMEKIDKYGLKNTFFIKDDKLYLGRVKVANFFSEMPKTLMNNLDFDGVTWSKVCEFKTCRDKMPPKGTKIISTTRNYKNGYMLSYLKK